MNSTGTNIKGYMQILIKILEALVMHTVIPALKRLAQDDCLKLQVSLDSTVSFRPIWATVRDLVSKNQRSKQKYRKSLKNSDRRNHESRSSI